MSINILLWTFFQTRKRTPAIPPDTERKLNLHKMFKRHPERLLNVLLRSIDVLCPGGKIRFQLSYKFATLLQKGLDLWCLFVDFAKFSKTASLTKHLWKIASKCF